jgi:cytochrome c biogenesis protein CcmG, thiol:disulfide interchange protein DsbE
MSTVEPEATPGPDALDGEGEKDRVGIMASEKTWIVPPFVKAATFWIMVLTIGGIGLFEVQKRATFRALLVDSVVEPEPWGNAAAPEVALPVLYDVGLDGDRSVRKLSDLRGRWVFLNFWATWCPPCRDEMPSMEMLQRRFGKDNFSIVTVSVDESEAEVARFFGAEKPSFQVLWDKQKTFSTQYGSTKFPETYLIDPEGRIAAKFTGPRDWYNQGTVQYFEDVIRGRRPAIRS